MADVYLVLQTLLDERARQDKKWGVQDHLDEWWLPIIVEEIGEVSKAMLEVQFGMGGPGDVHKELVEACATAMAWLECMARREIDKEAVLARFPPLDDG